MVGGSILQKVALGVPLSMDGFVMPAASGAILGTLLGILLATDREKGRQIIERSRRVEILNTEVLRRENELRSLLEDKELLIAEVHHRVRNLLQLLSSIIALEISLCDRQPAASERALSGTKRRIESIAIVYDQLIDPQSSLSIRLPDIVDGVVANSATESQGSLPRLDRTIADCSLPIGQSIPLALILSEMLDDAIHDRAANAISITISIDAACCRMVYHSESNGATTSVVDSCEETVKNGIVRALTDQLHGTVERIETDATHATVEIAFPLVGGVTANRWS